MFSKRARYALHGIGFLAYHHSRAPVRFADILRYLEDYSGGLSLSEGYISKVFQELSRTGIVMTVAGRKGGYALAKPPAEVRILDVVAAMDGYSPDRPATCAGPVRSRKTTAAAPRSSSC